MFNLSSLSKDIIFHINARFNRDYIIYDSIFSDTTSNFVSNPQPGLNEEISISLRTAKGNADGVYMYVDGKKLEGKRSSSDEHFDYYSFTYKMTHAISYYFSIHKLHSTCFYSNQGVTDTVDEAYNFRIIPDFILPSWVYDSVTYQIYVDRFYNGDPSNDVVNNEYTYLSHAAKHIENWDQGVAATDICNFYGGDLQGVIKKLDYLKQLGINCIYFTPLFVSPSNHKYDIQDYDYIDPHIGVIIEDGGDPLYFEKFHNRYATMYMKRTTSKVNLEASNKLFQTLVELAHKKGIKVILDGVFNHCGAFNKWLDKEGFYSGKDYPKGAYRDKNSPYHSYFQWYDDNWPNNDCYSGWWGHDNHPKLNFESSPKLYNYILEIGKKWVSPPFNADGWRLDVAADLGTTSEFNHRFWKDFRKAVKSANPNAIILAENYGESTQWLMGDEWDTVMNYDAFMEPVTWFLTGMEKHSEEFRSDLLCNAKAFEGAMRYHMSRFTYQSLYCAMNELSNHDHSRFLTRTNRSVGRLHTVGAEAADIGINKSVMYEAVTIQMTWPGAPTIYYGDEAGLAGWTDPDNRRTYPWGREDNNLIEFHKTSINLRKSSKALRTGSIQFLFFDYGIISYGRWDEKDSYVIIVNNNYDSQIVSIPVWKMGIKSGFLKLAIETHSDDYSTDPVVYTIKNGFLRYHMPAYSSCVLQTCFTE